MSGKKKKVYIYSDDEFNPKNDSLEEGLINSKNEDEEMNELADFDHIQKESSTFDLKSYIKSNFFSEMWIFVKVF
jgi:hypothetical protein